MAIGALRALRDLRLDIPGDVSVVGFDDIDLAPHTWTPRSRRSTSRSVARARRRSACFCPSCERRDLAKPEHRRLETRLIVRGLDRPGAATAAGGGRDGDLRSIGDRTRKCPRWITPAQARAGQIGRRST